MQQRQRELEEREHGFRARQEEMANRERELDELNRNLHERAKEFEHREAEFQDQRHEIERRQEELNGRERDIDARMHEFSRMKEDFAAFEKQLQERERDLDQREMDSSPPGKGGQPLLGVVLILLIILWVWSLQDCLRRPNDDFPAGGQYDKILWTLVLICTLCIGSILYVFLVQGRKR
jgi:hypothetical protein